MTRTITAMFDSRSEADTARTKLESTTEVRDVKILDQSSEGFNSSGQSSHQDKGVWASIKDMFLPDEDRQTYEEGMRRGHFLLTASVEEEDADEACRVLEGANSVDLDERSQQWRQSGWNYSAPAAGGVGGRETTMDRERGFQSGASTGVGSALGMGQTGGAQQAGRHVAEEHIPIVEEELRVGKREVNRGGVKVRSYSVDKPVHEEVTLRKEHVNVERRPVDRALTDADADAFRERTIDMTETSEEAVADKRARVREELVITKDADERVERIDDTVRHTEVDIDGDGKADRGALFGDKSRSDR